MSIEQVLANAPEDLSGHIDALIANLDDVDPDIMTIIQSVYVFRLTDDVSVRITIDENGDTVSDPELHDERKVGVCRTYELTPHQSEIVRARAAEWNESRSVLVRSAPDHCDRRPETPRPSP